jgi:ATPase family associated with various cellular activities (AAA)
MFNLKKQNSDTNSAVKTASEINPFADVPQTARGQFDLYFLAAAAQLIRQLAINYATREALFDEFPFLQTYDERLAGREPDDLSDEKADDWWENALHFWQSDNSKLLPINVLLKTFGFSHSTVMLLMIIGLIEEDARFGRIFEMLNEISDHKRLLYGTAIFWNIDKKSEQNSLQILHKFGFIQFGNTENPRSEWTLQPNIILWDALRGEIPFDFENTAKLIAQKDLPSFDKLILPKDLRTQITRLPKLFETKSINAVIIRGANRNSRQTILWALAKQLGLQVLAVKNAEIKDNNEWKVINSLAVLQNAMPIYRLDVLPGEKIEIPAINPLVKTFGFTIEKQGGLSGAGTEKSVSITVELPDEAERLEHWKEGLAETETDNLNEIGESFRLSSGNIRRAANLAITYSKLENREKVTISDIRQASRSLNRQALDALATYLEPLEADWSYLAIREDTAEDLRQLEKRCLMREHLQNKVGKSFRGQLQIGVRSLFNGVSGAGKTYAARILAAALQKDLYRLDLSTVVNKYIGETEKNLSKIFARVEELDVILLLDEGDALLTQRTSVSSSNDRYANLETNYLLQRLESFEGILIVTTNASERIDAAFQRRMDAVIEFTMPESLQRGQIWQLHLPSLNAISTSFLDEIIQRCELTGGQIRNVSLHAASLAVGENQLLATAHLESAIRREYRKIGTVCPLREPTEHAVNDDRW